MCTYVSKTTKSYVILFFIFTFIAKYFNSIYGRRKAIQAIVFFLLLVHAIVSCKNKEEVLNSINFKKIKINNAEADIISETSEMIFPSASIPEFKNHTALPFILTMVDDCYSEEDQNILHEGIAA